MFPLLSQDLYYVSQIYMIIESESWNMFNSKYIMSLKYIGRTISCCIS